MDNQVKAPLEIKAMAKKALRLAYGLSVDQWDTWMKKLRAIHGEGCVSKTCAILSPKEVKLITDHFGEP